MRKLMRARRKRALTDYKKRIELLKSGLARVIVRKSNRAISMQIAEYDSGGDRILHSVNSKELKAFGWEPRGNIPTAYLTGLLLAKKAKAAMKDRELVLDIGLYRPIKGTVIFAAAKGSVDGGINIISNIEFDAKRLSGAHIAEYSVKGDALAKASKSQFTAYEKAGFEVSKISEKFEEVKKKILSG
jgi:large subunit ribosomal protein L18